MKTLIKKQYISYFNTLNTKIHKVHKIGREPEKPEFILCTFSSIKCTIKCTSKMIVDGLKAFNVFYVIYVLNCEGIK